jgi:soluble lytic murein transglycosylase
MRAMSLYTQALTSLPNEIGGALELARVELRNDQTDAAVAQLTRLVSATGDIHAQLLLARTLDQNDSEPITRTIARYERALSAGTIISPYVQAWIAESYLLINQPLSAATYYSGAVGADIEDDLREQWRMRQALAYRRAGQFDRAIAIYNEMIAYQLSPSFAHLELSATLIESGKTKEGYKQLQDIVPTLNNPQISHIAIQRLLDANQPVDEFYRGVVNHAVRQYELARQAFARAIVDADEGTHRINDIRYWAARNYVALNRPEDALRNIEQILAQGKDASNAAAALLLKADILTASDIDAGVTLHRKVLSDYSGRVSIGNESTSTVYRKIAQAYEKAKRFTEAAKAYEEANDMHRAALNYYRAGQADDVARLTDGSTKLRVPTSQTTDAQIWRMKSDLTYALDYFRAMTTTFNSDVDYFAIRRFELANGVQPFKAANYTIFRTDGTPFDEKLKRLSGISPTETLPSLTQIITPTSATDRSPALKLVMTNIAALLSDPHYQRGMALWRIGEEDLANSEFNAIVNLTAITRYQLILRLNEIGAYRMAIRNAYRLTDQFNQAKIEVSPMALMQMYPRHYRTMIEAAAKEFNLDPYLLYAIVRQESLFEGDATSSASAHGLMQIIPSTGKEINDQLKWSSDYSARDLSRPYVNVRFGAYYLARMLKMFDGDVYAALAAYNAGASRAAAWRERAKNDPDLFLTEITLSEPLTYIERITENYAMYRMLYAP